VNDKVNTAEYLSPDINNTDESYSLTIGQKHNTIEIEANQYVGFVRALATLNQLIKPTK